MVRPDLSPLPIDSVLSQVVEALREKQRAVLCAPPGAGKTTRVPPALLDAGLADQGSILVLQPRRIAARATAARMSAERGTILGGEIGYRVRFESKVSRSTRIEVLTEGILLRRLLHDPFLEGVTGIIFDEFHERSLASDLALGMVQQIRAVRPELFVLVMSATLAAKPVADYLDDAPIIESVGRTYPVTVKYTPELDRRRIDEILVEKIPSLFAQHAGDCLVFLPGVGEIRNCRQALTDWADRNDVLLEELYGDLPPDRQERVLQPQSSRKVILSTNVAETSLTIEGITLVVDSGLARVLRYDETSGLDRLDLEPISKASADQRGGRAGRLQAGTCLRLWPEAAHRHRADFDTPEIRRVDLAGMVLQLFCWVEPNLDTFPWFEAPSSRSLELARQLLIQIQAVAADGKTVTSLGRHLANMPVHPRLSRLLIEAGKRGVSRWGAIGAALLSERDPFPKASRSASSYQNSSRQATTSSDSDLLDRVLALESFTQTGQLHTPLGTLHRAAAQQIVRASQQLEKLIPTDESATLAAKDPEQAFLQAVAVAYPDRIARRREANSPRGILVGGKGIRLADESAVHRAELFACLQVDGGQGEAIVRQASAVAREWLPAELVRMNTAVFFDENTDRIFARRQLWFDSLLLEEQTAALPDDEQPARILAEGAKLHWERAFPAEDSAVSRFVARVRCLSKWRPELELPQWTDNELQELLPDLCVGRRSLEELRQADWLSAVKGKFTYPQLQAIEKEAPERMQVPSGSWIALSYRPDEAPILAVRIQELFGWKETPRIAGGRIPVLLHLLAPNYRPEQITTDLASFWMNAYPQVRKDLRGRYPKHSWPEDPLTAVAQSRPQRKKPGG